MKIRPKMLGELPPSDEFPRSSKQQLQNLKWFLLKFNSQPAAAQLAILRIQIEDPESKLGYLCLQISSSPKSLGITALDRDNDLMR
jgi:hypothetical protein